MKVVLSLLQVLLLMALLLVALLPVPALGAASELYIPVAAHGDGAEGTVWRSDLEIKVRGSEPATFTIELLPEGLDNSAPLAITRTLGAGESKRYEDVLLSELGFTGNAALRLTATSGRLLASSRTYNDDPAGTYGQLIPALPADTAFGDGVSATLLQLSRSATRDQGYRCNLGLLNVTGEALELELVLFAADGTRLGTLPVSLLPYELRQLTDVYREVTDQEVADGYATIKLLTSGGRYLAYASVVDNRSGDAIFITAQEDDELDPPVEEEDRFVVFEAFMRHG